MADDKKKSWKTSVAGWASAVAGVAGAIASFASGDEVNMEALMTSITFIAIGLGLIKAKDSDK